MMGPTAGLGAAALLPLCLAALYLRFREAASIREAFVRSLLSFALAAVLFTEALGAANALRRWPLLLCWTILCAGLLLTARRHQSACSEPPRRPDLLAGLMMTGLLVVIGVAGFTAILCPPNSFDALAYHLPRAVYWTQAGSVDFFPTRYLNQLSMPPLSEYLVLQTCVLAGCDWFANLPAWLAFCGALAAVSLLARESGCSGKGQLAAALFTATLPNGILQASGTKNEWLLAFLLATAALYVLRFNRSQGIADFAWLSLAASLAAFTKGTAYLFLPPLALCLISYRALRPEKLLRWLPGLALPLFLLINGPLYLRNYTLSGSIFGHDSAHGDGLFLWRNESIGWRPLASNLLRHISEQAGGPNPAWNSGVFHMVLRLHSVLGINPDDPATTWRWSRYAPPADTNHETNANNRWHLLLLLAASAAVASSAEAPRRVLGLAGAAACGFLLFCAYLKWQPYQARMFLPLFVIVSPVAAAAWEAIRPQWIRAAVVLLLLVNSRSFLFQNWLRPLRGPDSILRTARGDLYFRDLGSLIGRESYSKAARLIADSGCRRVGIDTTYMEVEYPFQVLMLEAAPETRFLHVGVENSSRRYGDPESSAACAVACLECAGKQDKIGSYGRFGEPVESGRILIWFTGR